MEQMTEFIATVLTLIADFLWTEPIRWLWGIVLASGAVKLFKELCNI